MSTDVAVALRDKYVQKRLIKSAGIPVTEFYTVDLITDIKKINKPVIIKPLSGGGARDTFRVDSINKLGELRNLKHIGPWLVEDLVSGSELHLDGVIRDGEVKDVKHFKILNKRNRNPKWRSSRFNCAPA